MKEFVNSVLNRRKFNKFQNVSTMTGIIVCDAFIVGIFCCLKPQCHIICRSKV